MQGGWVGGGPVGPEGAELPLPTGAAPAAGRTTLFVGLVLIAAALGTAAYTYRSGSGGHRGVGGGTMAWEGYRGVGVHHDLEAAAAPPALALSLLPCLCPTGV